MGFLENLGHIQKFLEGNGFDFFVSQQKKLNFRQGGYFDPPEYPLGYDPSRELSCLQNHSKFNETFHR